MTRYRNTITYLIVGLLAITAIPVGSTAYAQYQIEEIPNGEEVIGDFVVGPGKVEFALEPGETRTTELLVTNRMGETRTFNLEVEDFTGSSDPEQTVVLLGDDRGPYSLRDYVSFPEASFELAQGERARIPVTISVPADAESGGLYGSVLVTTTSNPDEDADATTGARSGSVIVTRIGTLFFVIVPGEVDQEGALTDFATIPPQTFFWSGPVRFQLLFENTGSVHLNPYGGIRIRNMFGQEVAAIAASPWFALPQSKRFREIRWDREFLFGYYTAEAEVNRGYDDIIDTRTVSFVVIPWKVLVAAGITLLAIIFIARLIRRNFQISRRQPE